MENKFMRAIETAEILGISTLYQYWSEEMKNLVLGDARRQKKELTHLKYAYAEAIMNSRDERIRMQRELSKLLDIEVWEPENFTDEMRARKKELRTEIAMCRLAESNWATEKAKLEELN